MTDAERDLREQVLRLRGALKGYVTAHTLLLSRADTAEAMVAAGVKLHRESSRRLRELDPRFADQLDAHVALATQPFRGCA